MRIMEIREKGEVFSHEPGASTLVPRTFFSLQAFPSLWRLTDLKNGNTRSFHLDFEGPLTNFTLISLWKKGRVVVSGQTLKGFFKVVFEVLPGDEALGIRFEKLPGGATSLEEDGIKKCVREKDILHISCSEVGSKTGASLSFGNHKQHDWTLVQRRLDLSEILPFWYRAGVLLPEVSEAKDQGNSLLSELKSSLRASRPEMVQAFKNLFKTGFGGMFVPRSKDEEFQGFSLPPVGKNEHQLQILSTGKNCIEAMIFQYIEGGLQFLPHLPSELPCGRLVNLPFYQDGRECGQLFFEWSKGRPRRLFIKLQQAWKGTLDFKGIESFSLRRNLRAKKNKLKNRERVELQASGWYYIDNFQ